MEDRRIVAVLSPESLPKALLSRIISTTPGFCPIQVLSQSISTRNASLEQQVRLGGRYPDILKYLRVRDLHFAKAPRRYVQRGDEL